MLIVDLTDIARNTVAGGGFSGVQRVVFSLLPELLPRNHDDKQTLYFGYYADDLQSYMLIHDDGLREYAASRHRLTYGVSRERVLMDRSEAADNSARRARPGLASRLVKWGSHRYCGKARYLTKYDLSCDDTLLMLGSSWDSSPLLERLLAQDSAERCSVAFLFHDLIPLTCPHADLPPSFNNWFEAWFRSMMSLGPAVLCNSRSTRRDFLQYCARELVPPSDPFLTCLAHEHTMIVRGEVRTAVSALAEQEYVLYVGSLAGRKNGSMLLEIWDRLTRSIGYERCPVLVIAGSSNSGCVPTHLRGHLGDRIVLVTYPNDDELAHLYRHSLFGVFVSSYEGWGLPVGESRWHGKTCVVADNSSLREVGGSYCEYVTTGDANTIGAAIETLILDRDHLDRLNRRIDREQLRTWRGVAETMLAAVHEGSKARASPVR